MNPSNAGAKSRAIGRFLVRGAIYASGLALLGVCVTLMIKTNLGMSSWDAFYRNLNEGIPLEYKYLNPIIALLLLPIAYLLQKKKFTLWILFPLAVSSYVGVVIDFLKGVIPDVSELGIGWNLLYVGIAIPVCAVGLDMVTFCRFPLPALDELCFGIGVRMKSTYGRGKLVGEGIALVLTVLTGLLFHREADWFNIGPSTLVFAILIGPVIDWVKKPVYRVLEVFRTW